MNDENAKRTAIRECVSRFFLVHTAQIGLGIVGVQRVIFVEARQDAWIAVLISGLWIHLVVLSFAKR